MRSAVSSNGCGGGSQEKAESAVKLFGSLESDLPRPGNGEEVPNPGLPDTIGQKVEYPWEKQ